MKSCIFNHLILDTTLPQLIFLRNKLWSEIFTLIATLLGDNVDNNVISTKQVEAITILCNILKECGYEAFLKTLYEAIDTNCSTRE